MADSDEEFDADLDRLAREGPEEAGPHPAPHVLEAYQEERLEEARAEEVRLHLARCPACADLVLALAEGPSPAAGRWQDGGKERARRRLEQRGVLDADPREAGTEGGSPKLRGGGFSGRALAAALLVGAAAGCLLFAAFQGMGPPPSAANPQILYLEPRGHGVLRGGSEDPPAREGPAVFVLHTFTDPSVTRAEALLYAGERLLVRQPGLEREVTGTFTFSVQGGVLPPGPFRIELRSPEDPARAPLETYEGQLRPPEAPSRPFD